MDPVSLTVLTKAIGMLLLISFGGLSLYLGYRLYRDGKGSGKDSYAFEAGPIKLKANSVGSVVMATACVWGLAGIWMSPNLDKKGDEIRVYSFQTSAGEITSREVATAETPAGTPPAAALDNPEQLETMLQEAVATAQTSGEGSIVEVDGRPAAIDLQTVKATQSATGAYELNANVRVNGRLTPIKFEPRLQNNKVIFVPARVGMQIQN